MRRGAPQNTLNGVQIFFDAPTIRVAAVDLDHMGFTGSKKSGTIVY